MPAAKTLAAALPLLQAPFTPAAVKFKIQTNPKSPNGFATIVAYIDARLASERLNHVCPGDWARSYGQPIGNAVVCRLEVFGSVREDVGFGAGRDPDMATKAMYSDAFKRAGVGFGIATSLYALPVMRIRGSDLDSWSKDGKTFFSLSDGNDTQLRRGYAHWLARTEVKARFGEAIDHGDELAEPKGPQNFPQAPGAPAVNAAAFTAIAKDAKLGIRQVSDLLDNVGAPSGEDVQSRINSAPIEALDAAIEQIKAKFPGSTEVPV